MENWRKHRNSRCVAGAGNRRNELTAPRDRERERREKEREKGRECWCPFAYSTPALSSSSSSISQKLEFHYASLKVGNAFWQPPQSNASAPFAAQLKPNDAPLAAPAPSHAFSLPSSCPCLSSTAHSAQLSPVWATVLLGKFVILPNFSCGASRGVAAWLNGGRGGVVSRQVSTARRRSEWMCLTVQYA